MNGEIIGIYVHPQNWRNGVGSLLIEEACQRVTSDGFHATYLWTMTANDIANRFYQKVGFVKSTATRLSIRKGESFQESKYQRKLRPEPTSAHL